MQKSKLIKSPSEEKKSPSPYKTEYHMKCCDCESEWKTKVFPEKITKCPFCGSTLSTISITPIQLDISLEKHSKNTSEKEELFEYSIDSGGVCIRNYNHKNVLSAAENVIIPDKIAGIPVTNIYKDAFKYCENISSVVIPEGVKNIGGSAFYGCSRLKSIKLPDSLESISSGAFCGCRNLESIHIPPNVTYIGGRTFEHCSSLKEIVLSDLLTAINISTFYHCESLENIILPISIDSIAKDAFSGCTSLKKIIIPNNVVSIGKRAFYGCTNLKAIYIPESVIKIGELIFCNCKQVTVHALSMTYGEEYAKQNKIPFSNKMIY